MSLMVEVLEEVNSIKALEEEAGLSHEKISTKDSNLLSPRLKNLLGATLQLETHPSTDLQRLIGNQINRQTIGETRTKPIVGRTTIRIAIKELQVISDGEKRPRTEVKEMELGMTTVRELKEETLLLSLCDQKREGVDEAEAEATVEEAEAVVPASDAIKKDTWLENAPTLIRDKALAEAEAPVEEEAPVSSVVKKATSRGNVQTKAPAEAMKAEAVAEAGEEAMEVAEVEEMEAEAEPATSAKKRATSPENVPMKEWMEGPTSDREGMTADLSEEMTTTVTMAGTEEMLTTTTRLKKNGTHLTTMTVGMATSNLKEIGETVATTRIILPAAGETDA